VSEIDLSNYVVQVSGVSKKFKDLKALKELSFSVEKATCLGLLGPNGSGKTTMMKILYGKTLRDNPQVSQVNVFGYDPTTNELEIKYLSGIVPQEDNLDAELSVWQNLVIYSRFYGLFKKDYLPRLNYLLNFMELQPKRDSKIRELSGGMRRRLIIARALINSPRLLILDEPTTGLDPQVRHVIWEKLRLLKKEGVSILLTTHYMEEAFQICDKLIILHKGEKILEGEPNFLIEKNIEKYVLEILNLDHFEKVERKISVPRVEKTGNCYFIYSNDLEKLKQIRDNFSAGDSYLRQSNLEDLFLKITGRQLGD
jgi:lipooligosaccharide transport system ATP-binding protein